MKKALVTLAAMVAVVLVAVGVMDFLPRPHRAGAADASVTVARATVSSLPVFGIAKTNPVRHLDNPTRSGAPLVLLVEGSDAGWLHVLLPVRPNGSDGWVRSSDVRLYSHPYRILVDLSAHRLTLFEGGRSVLDVPAGIGRGATPTPVGHFFTTELLEPSNPQGAYGPFAMGLSGHSQVLSHFGTGDGVIGIHGTDDPTSVGHDVSHGCIRVDNAVITELARRLPLGVPVEIRA